MIELSLNANEFSIAQELFVRSIGFVYLLAFWSLFKQVLGLYGSKGIIPIVEILEDLKQDNRGFRLYLQIPTIFWLNASDQSLKAAAMSGMLFSIPVIFGLFPAFWLLLLWILYLSFVTLGTVFLSFQWDILLLEVGAFSIFFALQSPPPTLLLIASWVFLFRFMFSSGAVKILSGCPEWKSLKALTYHYETQPLPNRIAYYAYRQPRWLSKLSEISTFFFELAVPFFIFASSPIRIVACFLMIAFQLMIILTGNYAFFNVLSIALCFPLLDNAFFAGLIGPLTTISTSPSVFLSFVLNIVGLIYIILNALQLASLFIYSPWIYRVLKPFHFYYLINSYGLFACMTTKRDEIIILGSEDGQEWKSYEFKWKPGDAFRAPSQVAPYHPRLDWQMWFAALGHYQSNPWFINFLVRLLQGSKDVERLLKDNPFPDKPPKYIKAVIYEYHFTTKKEKEATGQWWKRSLKGDYIPTLTIRHREEQSTLDAKF